MRVILTRPQAQALQWLAALRAAGLDAVSWPLIQIVPTRDAAALHAAQAAASRFHALMFVSPNAVEYFTADGFFKQNWQHPGANRTQDAIKNAAISPTPATPPRCWATGAGTVQALQNAGVSAAHIDAPAARETAESEALWAHVEAQVQPGFQALIVRGANASGQLAGRPWLAEQLLARGAQVSQVAAYERHPPLWSAAQTHEAEQALLNGSVWVLSSSEAIHNLPQLHAFEQGRARAVATHERVAQVARERGFAHVAVSSPEPVALVRSIQSFA
jgi:uroporphyrinogen-III synthase